MALFGRKKKKTKGGFDPSLMNMFGQAARLNPQLYHQFKNLWETRGINVSERVMQLMAQDLQGGENPSFGLGAHVSGKADPGKLGEAMGEIDDQYTSVDIARYLSDQLRETVKQHAAQMREITEEMTKMTSRVKEMEEAFERAPDFAEWKQKFTEILNSFQSLMNQQSQIYDRQREIIESQTRMVKLFEELRGNLTQALIGEMQKYFDQRLGRDGSLTEVRDRLVELINANNELAKVVIERQPAGARR